MIVKSQLTEKEFIQVSLIMMYKKSATRTIAVMAFIFLSVAISGFIAAPEKANLLSILVPLAMLTALPLSIYFSAKKAFETIPQLQEAVQYTIDENELTVKGETYSVTYLWKDIFKVAKTTNWILIWLDKQRTLPIPTKDLSTEQITNLRKVLTANDIKNNLKE